MPDFMSMNRTNGESESLDILEIRDLLKQLPGKKYADKLKKILQNWINYEREQN